MDLDGTDILAALNKAGIGDIGEFTVATLPDPTLTPKRTAWATDLFGAGGRVVSEAGFWKPVRPLAVGSLASGNMTVTPLVTPPTLLITGTIGTGVTHNVTISTVGAYPGMKQRTVRKAGGLGNLVVDGVGLSLNSWQDWEFDGSTVLQTGSGGLL